MSKTYFAKVSQTMSWDELKLNISKQKENDRTPLPYEILTEIFISTSDFEKLSVCLSKTSLLVSSLYRSYAVRSVADSQGIWPCILIRCADHSKNILVYTAGNLYPLYASILDI